VVLSYLMTRAQHQALVEHGLPVTPRHAPELHALVTEVAARLQTGPVKVFVVRDRTLNAYTFGLVPPQVVVLNSGLLEVLDRDEVAFVVGHELGHVRLGHTWLNSLIGGMAGIPSPFAASALLAAAFLWWNRACEYSADRAGLLACGRPEKAISALVRLALGERGRSVDLERALRYIQAEDDDPLSSLGEVLSTHPMMGRRIEQLRRYAASAEYRRLQPLLAANATRAL
jgi:Zn-dependent protease with chaperone function